MLAIISDVHGKYAIYKNKIDKYKYTLQIGDLGYNYTPIKQIHGDNNIWFGGNHENMPMYYDVKGCIGDYGPYTHGGIDFFFVRGAASVDKAYRIEKFVCGEWPQTWFKEEELTEAQFEDCYNKYLEIKPDVVVTHDAPQVFVPYLTRPEVLIEFGLPIDWKSRTSVWLNKMWEAWQPSIWVNGHFHKSKTVQIEKTRFICLKELEVLELHE